MDFVSNFLNVTSLAGNSECWKSPFSLGPSLLYRVSRKLGLARLDLIFRSFGQTLLHTTAGGEGGFVGGGVRWFGFGFGFGQWVVGSSAHTHFSVCCCATVWAQALRPSPPPPSPAVAHRLGQIDVCICMLVNVAWFIADVALSLTTVWGFVQRTCNCNDIERVVLLDAFCIGHCIWYRLRNQVESGSSGLWKCSVPLQLLHHMSQGLASKLLSNGHGIRADRSIVGL